MLWTCPIVFLSDNKYLRKLKFWFVADIALKTYILSCATFAAVATFKYTSTNVYFYLFINLIFYTIQQQSQIQGGEYK